MIIITIITLYLRKPWKNMII